jgi:hypothetical protein
MIIEDFVMLGRTVPEQSRRHGLVTCSAGYSREHGGFMRVYPLPMESVVKRWDVCRIKLERPKQDSRKESFRIADGSHIEVIGKAKKDDEFDYLHSIRSRSIAALNQDRESLAIIQPANMTCRFDKMKIGEEYQMALPLHSGESAETPKPRIQFDDDDGHHDLQLRDWGSTILLNRGYDKHHLWNALRLNDPGYDHLLFCGNHNTHRNNWLVISVVSRKKNVSNNLRLF